MGTYTINVYSEQSISEQSGDVIRAIVDAAFPDHTIKFQDADKYHPCKVLVFGKPPQWLAHEYIFTYSIAQIMTKANAASVLAAGIRQFIEEPEPIPFERPEACGLATTLGYYLDPTKPVAIDIETDGLLGKTHTPEEVNIISLAMYQPGHAPIVLVSNYHNGRQMPLQPRQLKMLAEVLPKFEYAIYHNGKFDTRILNRLLGTKLVNNFDTMLAHHVLNHAAGDHKLKNLARRYLGAPEWEKDLGKYTKGGGHYELIPEKLLVEYNGYDVYWTYKLWEFLEPQIEADDNNRMAFALEMAAADFLLDVEEYGIPYDSEYATTQAHELQKDMEYWQQKLGRLTGNESFNPNSPQQVKKYIEYLGYLPSSTDEEHLKELAKEHPLNQPLTAFVNAVLTYRAASKTRGTYYVGWMNNEREGRVHPTFLVHGTSTGRLSSTGPNAQNVPRDKVIRKMVTTHGR